MNSSAVRANMGLVHRWLIQCGWEYTKVLNISDVDDETFVINIQTIKNPDESHPVYVNRNNWTYWVTKKLYLK